MPSASEILHDLGRHVFASGQTVRILPALEPARSTLLILCLIAGFAEAGEQVAPTVVHTDPASGARFVDADTSELRVTFDQPMDAGYSFVGGGPAFPEVTGQPEWITATTIVLPVKLEPDRQYRLSINSDRHRNFRGINGLSAVPYPLSFRTARSDAETLNNRQNRQSLEQLRSAIETRYSHRNLRNVDWNSVFSTHEPQLLEAGTPTEFARLAGQAFGVARDPHIWLEANGRRFASFRRDARPNADLSLLKRQIPGFRSFGPAMATGRLHGGPAYLMIASWERQHARDIDAAAAWIDGLPPDDSLILDVRLNGGGDERLAAEIAGRFQQHSVVYARHRFRDTSNPSGYSDVMSRSVNPIRPGFRGKTVVLMGQANMSAAEAFLLMMKQAPHCTLMGERSYGSSGNPRPVPLANGVTVYLPSWITFTLDGIPLEGNGVAPDVFVPFPRESANADPLIDAARHLLAPD